MVNKKNPKGSKSTNVGILKFDDLLKLEVKQLNNLVITSKKDLKTLQYNTKLGDVQNVHAYKYKKRYLARLLTAMHQKNTAKEEI